MNWRLLSHVVGGTYGFFLGIQYFVFYLVLALRKEREQLKQNLFYISLIAVSILFFSIFGELSARFGSFFRILFLQLKFLVGLLALNAFVSLLRYYLVLIKDMTFVETDSYKEQTRKYLKTFKIVSLVLAVFLAIAAFVEIRGFDLLRISEGLLLLFLSVVLVMEPIEFIRILRKERGKLNHFHRLRFWTVLGTGEIAFFSLFIEILFFLFRADYQFVSAFMCGSIALTVGLSLSLIFEHMELLSTVNESNRKLNELNQRIMDDIRTAQSLQISLLPVEKQRKIRKALDIEVSYMPMQSVGGDYYDYYLLEDSKILIILGDASGHGVYAAMIWAMLKVEVEELIEEGAFGHLGKAFELLNKRITRILENTYSYATLFSCVVDIKNHAVSYLTAGHSDQLYFNSLSGEVKRIRNKNPIVGTFKSAQFHDDTIYGSPGDIILLFTDGITEAQNSRGEQFQMDRLEEIFKKACLKDRSEAIVVLTAIMMELEDFTEDAIAQDDRTMIAVRL